MPWFAISIQGEIEKYGAYVGIAAFFGLAVLSLLYFAQARELRRLRDWAGRAPERAQELEQRVVAQADAARQGPPTATGAPRRLAEMPIVPPPPAVTPAAATAAAAAAAAPQATVEADSLAEADAEEAAASTNGHHAGPVPPPAEALRGPGGEHDDAEAGEHDDAEDAGGEESARDGDETQAANGAATAAAEAGEDGPAGDGEHGDETERADAGEEGDRPAAEAAPDDAQPVEAAPDPVLPAARTAAAAAASVAAAQAGAVAAGDAQAGEADAPAAAAGAAPADTAGPARVAQPGDDTDDGPTRVAQPGGTEDGPTRVTPADGEPGPTRVSPPEDADPGPTRITPAANGDPGPTRVTHPADADADGELAEPEVPPASAVPRATPVQPPLTSSRPAPAQLRASQPSASPRRPGSARPRRGSAAAPREGRSAGTIALLAGIAVLIVGAGAFAASQLLGGSDQPQQPNTSSQPATASPTPGTTPGATGKPPAQTVVAVLNGTTFNGLAGTIADQLGTAGYQRGATVTNPDQTLQSSTVFYGSGARANARRIARRLNIADVRQVDAQTRALAPGADVIVLAGADQAP